MVSDDRFEVEGWREAVAPLACAVSLVGCTAPAVPVPISTPPAVTAPSATPPLVIETPTAVHLTPWDQCWVEAGSLLCHQRSDEQNKRAVAWSLPSGQHELWRLDAGPVRHFDGDPDGGCAALMDGSVRCWSHGEEPRPVEGLQDVRLVAYSGTRHRVHACGLDERGTVWCWEASADSEGSFPPLGPPREILSRALHLAVSGSRGCAIREDGRVACWDDSSTVVAEYDFPRVPTQLAMSRSGPCARLDDGTVSCVNESNPRSVVPIEGVRDAVAITAADRHLCALRRDGAVLCWSVDSAGQLGSGRPGGPYEATPVADLWDAAAVYASDLQSCAQRTNREVVCWGRDAPYRDVIGEERLEPPTRVWPERELPEATQQSTCGRWAPTEFELSSLRQRIEETFEQGGEEELRVLFDQLWLAPLPASETLPPGLYLIPHLERLDIDRVPIVSERDVVVQLLIINIDGGWYEFRAQAFRPIGANLYCPVLSELRSVGDLAGQWSCHREARREPPWHWSFAPALEPNRYLIVTHDYTDHYDGSGECPQGDIRRSLSFHAIEAGKYSAPLLTLDSQTTWRAGERGVEPQWAERVPTFALEGDYPKRIVVTERRTTCTGTDRPGCREPTQREAVTVYGFDGQRYAPLPQNQP